MYQISNLRIWYVSSDQIFISFCNQCKRKCNPQIIFKILFYWICIFRWTSIISLIYNILPHESIDLHGSKIKLKHMKGIGSLVEHRLHKSLVQVELLAWTCVVPVYCTHAFACHLPHLLQLYSPPLLTLWECFLYFVKNGRKWWGDGLTTTTSFIVYRLEVN